MAAAFNIAIIGATGIVGSTLLAILEERQFPVKKLYLLASARSVGDLYEFKNQSYSVEDVAQFDFSQTQLCFFCASNAISEKYAPQAVQLGNIVIDKSSHFRYHKDVPLIIPEVNPEALAEFAQSAQSGIIASPNCSTIPIAMALKPIDDAVGVTRVNIATYQSVSGTGKDAVAELVEQTVQSLNGMPIESKIYPQQIAFNLLPHIDEFMENGYTQEEMKLVWELQKILNNTALAVNPTAVRVPVFYGHAAAVHIETKKKITAKKAMSLLTKMPGVKLKNPYPTPVQDAAGKDDISIGRIREDISCEKGLNFWVVGDNLRKGAALNAVHIAEKLIEIGKLC